MPAVADVDTFARGTFHARIAAGFILDPLTLGNVDPANDACLFVEHWLSSPPSLVENIKLQRTCLRIGSLSFGPTDLSYLLSRCACSFRGCAPNLHGGHIDERSTPAP